MKFLLPIILLISFTAHSQKTTLRVLGQSNYTLYAETNVMVVSFDEKTGALKQEILKTKMDSIGVKTQLKPLENSTEEKSNLQRFEIEEEDLVLFEKLLFICYNLGLNVGEVYFKMPLHSYQNEDKYAYQALKNAESQAKVITNSLNYKIVQILNIDDETQFADPLFDFIDPESRSGKMLLNIFRILGNEDSNERKSKEPIRNGGYNLWVTFEIKEK